MKIKKTAALLFVLLLAASILGGCAGKRGTDTTEKRIIRIGHNQATTHPTHIALKAFEEYIESNAGDRYDVEIYPSELLGSQDNMVQLTQTGAIDISIASNAILGSFSKNYDIFNLPYLFASKEAFVNALDDPAVTDPIFKSTTDAGFTAVTWLDAGTRNFYTVDRQINTPSDLRGMKIRVQQSEINIQMMNLLGGSATPMGFGEVYTALQSHVIDGAENNELALTNNGHGDVCKYYSYDMHQMIPDIVIANNSFLQEVEDSGDLALFEEGFRLINSTERENWNIAIEEALKKAVEEQHVELSYPDQAPFVEACAPLTHQVLSENPELQPIYDAIQSYNAAYPADSAGEDAQRDTDDTQGLFEDTASGRTDDTSAPEKGE